MQNGMTPIVLPQTDVDYIMGNALKGVGYQVTVDLEAQTVTDEQGFSASFDFDPFRRNSLLKGLDDIGITLQNSEAIGEFEAARAPRW